MDPVTTKRDAISTCLSIQDSELMGPAPRLETNNSLAKLGLKNGRSIAALVSSRAAKCLAWSKAPFDRRSLTSGLPDNRTCSVSPATSQMCHTIVSPITDDDANLKLVGFGSFPDLSCNEQVRFARMGRRGPDHA